MRTVMRSRRVLAGLAGLALGMATALAAAPAQAQSLEPEPLDTCAGTHLLLPGLEGGAWTVTVAGEAYFPAEGDDQPGAGEVVNLFIPADAGEIGWSLSTGGQEVASGTHTWTEPEDPRCDEFPPPTHTPPTCDAPGTITIPELPEDLFEDSMAQERPLARELRVVEPKEQAVEPKEPDPGPGIDLFFQLDGDKVEAGSTHEVEPGTHEVTLHVVFTFGAEQLELIIHRWVVEIEEPDCPDDGEGGELPKTGVPTGLLAGGAALLVAAGAGMYLVARRRRITFTV